MIKINHDDSNMGVVIKLMQAAISREDHMSEDDVDIALSIMGAMAIDSVSEVWAGSPEYDIAYESLRNTADAIRDLARSKL